MLVLAESGKMGPGAAWLCRCDCGAEKRVRSDHLRQSRVLSCGCLQQTNRVKHGAHGTRTYRAWADMKGRCSPTNHHADRYHARGIRVCERWATSFEAFRADMGECPDGMELDRIDNDRGYEPGNCRWTTRRQQMLNTSKTRGASMHVGVARHRGKWRAYGAAAGKAIHLGVFDTQEAAAEARAAWLREQGANSDHPGTRPM
jgi:hypothetical protein